MKRYRIKYKNVCKGIKCPVKSAYVTIYVNNDTTAEESIQNALVKFRALMLKTPNDYEYEIISIQSVPMIETGPNVAESPNVRLILSIYHSENNRDSMVETIEHAITNGLDLSDAEIQYLLESVVAGDLVGPEDIREDLIDNNHIEIVVKDGIVKDIVATDPTIDATVIYVDHDDDDDAMLAVLSHIDQLIIVKDYCRIKASTLTPENLLTKESKIPRIDYNKDLDMIVMTPSAANDILRIIIDAANDVSGKPEGVRMLLDTIHTLTDGVKWLPDESAGMQVHMDVDTLDTLIQKIGEILINIADDDRRFITMLANALADAHKHKSDTREHAKSSIKLGDIVKLGSCEWVVQHVDGDRVYLALRSSPTLCTANAIDSMLKSFTERMRLPIGCNFHAFVPSKEQLETEWAWPSASASNRIYWVNDSNVVYWTSSAASSSSVWYVNRNGEFCVTDNPTVMCGFRPAIEIGIDDLTRILSIKPGDDVLYGDQHWVVQHVENGKVTMALKRVYDFCISSKIDSMLDDYRMKIGERVGHPVNVFVPTKEQLDSRWDWPKAGVENRHAEYLEGIDVAYWTSSNTRDGYKWYTSSSGKFYYGYPTQAFGFRPAIEVTMDELIKSQTDDQSNGQSFPFSLGDVVIYGNQRWTIQHIANGEVYMATTDVVDMCALHHINDMLNDWKADLEHMVGHEVNVFIPDRRAYEVDWDWPGADHKNRVCKNRYGCNSTYWTNSTTPAGLGWFVNFDGKLDINHPSATLGFRPAIKVTADELIKKGTLDGSKEG